MARKKKDHDFAVNAFSVAQEATDPKTLDPDSTSYSRVQNLKIHVLTKLDN